MEKVLEIGGYAAGYCGRLFSHAGADVVRFDVDSPGPAWSSEQAMSMYLHAGKRSVVGDAELLAKLAQRADIVICEVAQADGLTELGFDEWQTPVKVAITPFGRTGPKRNWRASSNVLLAMGGYTHLIGDPGQAPLSLPGHYVEFQTGTIAYTAVNACRLAGATKTIDIGMLESLLTLSQFTTVRWHCAGEVRGRHGNDFWFVVPSNLFACSDGWVYLNIVPTFWDPLTVFLEQPELLIDPRFLNNDLRMQHREELHELIADILCGLTRQEIMTRAETCRIPMGVVKTFADVLDDEHLAARAFWEPVSNASGAVLKSPGLPYNIDRRPRPKLQPATVALDSAWRS